MAVTQEQYDVEKIEKLKSFLEAMSEKGQPRFFEIHVDSFKVVPKTSDAKEFDSFEPYVDENTKKIKIVIYDSPNSPRNNKYVFLIQGPIKNAASLNGFNGLGDLDGIIQEKLAVRDREYEMSRIREELQKTKEQLSESEEYADTLEQQIQTLQDNKFKLGNINVAELASVALEGMIRRNPQLLTKLPGGEALAGVIEQDNAEKIQAGNNPVTESQASFQKKSSGTDLKPEHLRYIPLLQQMDNAFNVAELEVMMAIIQKLAEEPHNLKTVSELLNIQNP